MWIRLHTPPKKVKRIRPEFRSPKLRYLFERSRERYDRTADGMYTKDVLRMTLWKGEIGRIDEFRIITTKVG